MGVFQKAKPAKSRTKMVGVYLPPPLFSFLNLFVLSNSISKTSVLLTCVENWVISQKRITSESTLLNKLTQKSINHWKRISKDYDNIDLFKSELKEELEEKGLTATQVRMILNSFINGTN